MTDLREVGDLGREVSVFAGNVVNGMGVGISLRGGVDFGVGFIDRARGGPALDPKCSILLCNSTTSRVAALECTADCGKSFGKFT